MAGYGWVLSISVVYEKGEGKGKIRSHTKVEDHGKFASSLGSVMKLSDLKME